MRHCSSLDSLQKAVQFRVLEAFRAVGAEALLDDLIQAMGVKHRVVLHEVRWSKVGEVQPGKQLIIICDIIPEKLC